MVGSSVGCFTGAAGAGVIVSGVLGVGENFEKAIVGSGAGFGVGLGVGVGEGEGDGAGAPGIPAAGWLGWNGRRSIFFSTSGVKVGANPAMALPLPFSVVNGFCYHFRLCPMCGG